MLRLEEFASEALASSLQVVDSPALEFVAEKDTNSEGHGRNGEHHFGCRRVAHFGTQ